MTQTRVGGSATAPSPQRHDEEITFLGHPRGLFVLFFAEMWERFSYYGMRALLVLYLAHHFLFDDRFSSGLVATYGSMVYLMPIIGGFIADRYLGFRKAVVAGAILLCFGHALMAFEGTPATLLDGGVVRDDFAVGVLYLALSCIIVGVGFLKPAISNIVGQLYGPDDARRDQGFTIFYMGINLGALSAMLLCGWLGQAYGWGYGFGLAGIGMLAGLATFIGGQRWFSGAGEPPAPSVLRERLGGITREHLIYVGAVVAIAATWWLLQHRAIVGSLLGIVSAAAVVGVVLYSVLRCTRVERDRMFSVLFLTLVSVVFWTLFEQAGTSMTFFTERNVHTDLLGVEMQASQMGFLNPAFVILLAPLFSIAWRVLARQGMEPSTPMKFGLGVVQAGLGFLVLVFGAGYADSAGQVAVAWLVLAYLLHTTGELCLSPVGLSMVTRLSVAKVLGLMMGVWFLSSAAASYLAGLIAGAAAVERAPGAEVDALASLPTYVGAFEVIGYAGVAIGIVVMLVTPLVRRLMHE